MANGRPAETASPHSWARRGLRLGEAGRLFAFRPPRCTSAHAMAKTGTRLPQRRGVQVRRKPRPKRHRRIPMRIPRRGVQDATGAGEPHEVCAGTQFAIMHTSCYASNAIRYPTIANKNPWEYVAQTPRIVILKRRPCAMICGITPLCHTTSWHRYALVTRVEMKLDGRTGLINGRAGGDSPYRMALSALGAFAIVVPLDAELEQNLLGVLGRAPERGPGPGGVSLNCTGAANDPIFLARESSTFVTTIAVGFRLCGSLSVLPRRSPGHPHTPRARRRVPPCQWPEVMACKRIREDFGSRGAALAIRLPRRQRIRSSVINSARLIPLAEAGPVFVGLQRKNQLDPSNRLWSCTGSQVD